MLAPTSGRAACRAATTYVQKDGACSSPASRDTQATARCSAVEPASHAVTAVVLPKPAGAETSVSFASARARSREVRRVRSTALLRSLGTNSLVATRGLVMIGPLPRSRPTCADPRPPRAPGPPGVAPADAWLAARRDAISGGGHRGSAPCV